MNFSVNPFSRIPNPNERHLKGFLMRDNWQQQFLSNALKLIDSLPVKGSKKYEQEIALAATKMPARDSEVKLRIPSLLVHSDVMTQPDGNCFVYFHICNDFDWFKTHYLNECNDMFFLSVGLKEQEAGINDFFKFFSDLMLNINPELSIRYATVYDLALLLGAISYYQENRSTLGADDFVNQVMTDNEFYAVGEELRISINDCKHNYLSWLLAEAQFIVDTATKYP